MNKWTLGCLVLVLVAASNFLKAEERHCYEAVAANEEMINWQDDSSLYCEEMCSPEATSFFVRIDPTLKLRIAAFWPSSDRFHEIYGRSMPSYQIEGGFTFCERYQTWLNVDWISKKGHSDHLHDKTNITIGNVSMGLSFGQELSERFSVYAGIGPCLGSVHIHNRVTKHHRNERKYAWGVVVKSGVIYNINCRFFLDFFLDYSYQQVKFNKHVNVGGLKAGVGIGTHF